MKRCRKCDQAHGDPDFLLEDPCVFHDPPEPVSPSITRVLRRHRGLPEDCPGCLGEGTIERTPIGRAKEGRHHHFRLACKACRVEYFEEVR